MSLGLHERLRAATAPAHRALESDLDWESRIATRDGYRVMLERLRGFHAAYEPAIGGALADETFFAPRRRLAKLDADLAHLGLAAGQIADLPRPRALSFDGRPQAFGALYVLEGSTLGGQVIGRAIERLHGFGAEGGCAYYRGHGRETGIMWRSFRDALESLPDDPAADDAAAASAVATFEAMRAWLTAPIRFA